MFFHDFRLFPRVTHYPGGPELKSNSLEASLIPYGAVVNPDVPPGDVEAVRVERRHVNDVVVVLFAGNWQISKEWKITQI